MKSTRLTMLTILVFSLAISPFIFLQKQAQALDDGSFYLGVTYGGNTFEDAKTLIDEVKQYTNLFIVDSWDISGAPNSTALDKICDYAISANLSVIVYFDFIFYNVTTNISSNSSSVYNASTWDIYGFTPWHISWIDNAKEKWGNKFLGVYLMDEPGGNQIDRGYWGGTNTTFSGRPVSTFRNITDYTDVAEQYISSIRRNRSMQILTNTSYPDGLKNAVPVFTSDYALYWFTYQTGYDTLFVELGDLRGTNNTVQQIAQCRGAAEAQNKDWGAIITWASEKPPYLETGEEMLQDMTAAFNAGAKYIVVFNFPQGVLRPEHFEAMKTFWNNTQLPLSRPLEKEKRVALLLPRNYGWGMRDLEDKIWGFWPPDNISSLIWNNMNNLINKFDLNIDIVYDDPQFDLQTKYAETFLWNSTITFDKPATSTPFISPNDTITLPTSALHNSTSENNSIPIQNTLGTPIFLTALLVSFASAVSLTSFYFFRKRNKRKNIEFSFPGSPTVTTLKDTGKGSFEFTDNTIEFIPENNGDSTARSNSRKIPLTQVQTIEQTGNELLVVSDQENLRFLFEASETPIVYQSLKGELEKQKAALREEEILQERKILFQNFKGLIELINPLFDLFIGLHGKIDWDFLQKCVKDTREILEKTQHTNPNTIKPKINNLYLLVENHKLEEASIEAQNILKIVLDYATGLNAKNESLEQSHPNYQDFRTAIAAYYVLNDILLGEVVEDEEVTNEYYQLSRTLNNLFQENKEKTQFNPLKMRATAIKGVMSRRDFVVSNRLQLVEQLMKVLDPESKTDNS
jgi:hypothetical protein